jgi:voltage-gated potassium channel
MIRIGPGGGDGGDQWARVVRAFALLVGVLAAGTIGYLILGLSMLDSVYQSVTTVTTVGFREVGEPDAAFKIFTVVLVLAGAGSVLYALGVLLEALVEGSIGDQFGRRRMQREVENVTGHVIVAGWGRVGRSIAATLAAARLPVVVVEKDPERQATVGGLLVGGDATDDEVLERAGIDRARALVAALNSDADNLYVTLSARRLRPDLFIVARARVEAAEAKLAQAGADRVVNPQAIGGARMAALVNQPHVADFLDVVMHDAGLEFRLGEHTVAADSPIAGKTLRDAQLRDTTGALVLAMRDPGGGFRTNPAADAVIEPGDVLITIGTDAQLKGLADLVAGPGQ